MRTLKYSKTKIDKAGRELSKNKFENLDKYVIADEIFNHYRKEHLLPITEVTLKLQEWLTKFSEDYYIAQRLKRRPQILRKLNRFSVRLTQLQDIGGCRIIVENNDVVNNLLDFIETKLIRSKYFKINKKTDYREKGRDDSGYRAVHLIVERNGFSLEVQLRSRIQHYWAESIERTSVIYGYRLKEQEGDKIVLNYFKLISNVFYEIEMGRKPAFKITNELNNFRNEAEKIIKSRDVKNVLESKVNDKYLKAMIAKESKQRGKFHNWMLIFNWNTGNFENWSLIERDIEKANNIYIDNEKRFPAQNGYEVVMIGSSDASTIQHTHSHYFGIENYDQILEDIDDSLIKFKRRKFLSKDELSIVKNMYNKNSWGKNKTSIDTLRKHFCKSVKNFDEVTSNLANKGVIIIDVKKKVASLNTKKKNVIENHV